MKPLASPDAQRLKAAEGWFELGDHVEADAELDRITAPQRSHPDVLALRWQIHAKARHWELCAEIGQTLVNAAVRRPTSWLYRSAALHELKRTQEALDQLEAAATLFTDDWRIPYALACYSCQLGNQDEAWEWLTDAIDLSGTDAVKVLALEEKDLEPFWAEIGAI